jgi:Bacterial self-protective colicin-like immunity
MENCGEIHVIDFVRLMRDYLDRRIDVEEYRKKYFELSKRRLNISNEQVDRIIQRSYGDADDYDALLRLPYTITEPELRGRVADSLSQLSAMGYKAE